jgi:hypothetical protein
MSLSSLPKYPTPQAAPAPRAREIVLKFSLRMARVFLSLAFLMTLAVVLHELRQMTMSDDAPPSAPPLAFKLIQERYGQLFVLLDQEKVEELLGPPTERYAWEDEFREWEEQAEHWRRDLEIPRERSWDKWTDPKDAGKWVAVLHANGKIYWKAKNGF